MKLSSPPTRYAFTSVIAAAMKYGPTRVSRIAYELDMPVETCRYYLKRFHNAGFRFLPVVDYRALGLQPCILFIRFSKNLDQAKRENFLRWLDTVYIVYRAALDNQLEYYIEVVPPQGEIDLLKKMMSMLTEAGVLNNFSLSEVIDGYYQPAWIKTYDFSKSCWSEKLEIEIAKLPLSSRMGLSKFDKVDLVITKELEKDPTVKMKKIAHQYEIPAQLVSYHREKHIEGNRLIVGYIPARRVRHEDLQIYLLHQAIEEQNDGLRDYLLQVKYTSTAIFTTIHAPHNFKLNLRNPTLRINSETVRQFTIPLEHFSDGKWTTLNMFVDQLEELIKTV